MSGELPWRWIKFSNLWKGEKIQKSFMPVRFLRKCMLLKYSESMEDALSDIYCSQETSICTWSSCFKLQICKVARQPGTSYSHYSVQELETHKIWGNMHTTKKLAADFEQLQRHSSYHEKESLYLQPRKKKRGNYAKCHMLKRYMPGRTKLSKALKKRERNFLPGSCSLTFNCPIASSSPACTGPPLNHLVDRLVGWMLTTFMALCLVALLIFSMSIWNSGLTTRNSLPCSAFLVQSTGVLWFILISWWCSSKSRRAVCLICKERTNSVGYLASTAVSRSFHRS